MIQKRITRSRSAKLEPLEVRQLLSAAIVPGQWILRVDGVAGKGATHVKNVNALLAKARPDARATRWLGGAGFTLVQAPVTVTQAQLSGSLKNIPGFQYIEPDYLVSLNATVNDPSFTSLWGLNNTGQSGGVADADIDAPEAWDVQKGNGTVVVGVVDTGVDYTHPDLAATIFINTGEIAGDNIDNDNNGYIDDTRGWDFYNFDNNPMDDNGHGSHVSGTIAGIQNNSVGVAGVANAKILPLKFLSASGSGFTSDAIGCINYATMMKRDKGVNVRVLSNSWGGGGFSQGLLDAINASGTQGIVFTAAAGNSNSNNDTTPSYPASYNAANIISIAATTRTDARASYSSYGATSVDLGAPGSEIYSTVPGGYATYSGTSMATPHVSGVAALLFTSKPTATVAEVKTAILNGTDKISSMNGITLSGGRLNALGALQQLGTPTSPPPPPPTSPPPPPPGVTLPAPTALVATTISRTQINLSWTDNSSTELGFKIERSTNGTSFTQIATVGANVRTYSSTGLRKNRTYYFRVRAYDASSNSAYSNVASKTTLRSLDDPIAGPAFSSTFISADSAKENDPSELLDSV